MDYRGLFSGRKLRVGVFLSGQLRNLSALPDIVNNVRREFPSAKIIGCMWQTCFDRFGSQSERLGIPIHIKPEPVINYNPYWANEHSYDNHWSWRSKKSHWIEVEDKFEKTPDPKNRHTHQTKMILGHTYLVKKYYNDFDIMIRARWDHFLGEGLHLYELCEETYRLPAIISLGCRDGFRVNKDYRIKTLDTHNSRFGLPFVHQDNRIILQKDISPFVTDYGLIFHRNVDWPVEFIENLHENKKLLPAEWGWWQTIIERKSMRYIHYDGGSGIYRTLVHNQW